MKFKKADNQKKNYSQELYNFISSRLKSLITFMKFEINPMTGYQKISVELSNLIVWYE